MHDTSRPEDRIGSSLFRRIAVPLDGTDEAEDILPYVCEIAGNAGVPLLLHSVVDPSAIEYPTFKAKPPAQMPAGSGSPGSLGYELRPSRQMDEGLVVYKDQVEAGLVATVENRLQDIESRLRDEGVEAEVRVTLGNPAEEIPRVADEGGCGIISMSTHGRNPVVRSILGSVTNKVTHSSTLPVLTIAPRKAGRHQEREETALATVIVPLDGSELAERALPYAEELARSLSLDVILTRVVTYQYPVYALSGYANLPNLTDELVWEATTYLEGVARSIKQKGIKAQCRVLRGVPTHELLGLAHRTPKNIVVMTTHGRSGLARWMMGSVAEAMIRASGDPVLLIPSNTERESE